MLELFHKYVTPNFDNNVQTCATVDYDVIRDFRRAYIEKNRHCHKTKNTLSLKTYCHFTEKFQKSDTKPRGAKYVED